MKRIKLKSNGGGGSGCLRGKKAAFTDIFLLMILSFVIVVILGIIIYTATRITSEVKDKTKDMTDLKDVNGNNVTEVIDNTLGQVVSAYQALYWIAVLLIFGMIMSIFIGSYMVTTRPVFFVPYVVFLIIAIVVAVGISNAYEELMQTPELTSVYNQFGGASYFLLYLPLWVTIIGFIGAIIMYSRLGKNEQMVFYGYG